MACVPMGDNNRDFDQDPTSPIAGMAKAEFEAAKEAKLERFRKGKNRKINERVHPHRRVRPLRLRARAPRHLERDRLHASE
jgi:hypothetical protein